MRLYATASIVALLACGAAPVAPSVVYDRFLSVGWSYHFQGPIGEEGLDSIQGTLALDLGRTNDSLSARSFTGNVVLGYFWSTNGVDTTHGVGAVWPPQRVQRGRLVDGHFVQTDNDSWLNHPQAVFQRPSADTLVYILAMQDASGIFSLIVTFVKQ